MLAGGASRRFGSDKALHAVDGEPLVVRTARVLADAGLEAWVVARHARGLGLREVIEPDGPRHPLWGVAAALRHADAAGDGLALVVPTDLADLGPDDVRAVLARPPGLAEGQPLFGVLPVWAAGEAARLAGEGAPVRRFAAGFPRVRLRALTNRNEPPPVTTPGAPAR